MRDRNGGPKGPKGSGFRSDGPRGPRKPGGFGGKSGDRAGGFRSREGGDQRRDGRFEGRGDGPKRPYFKASAPGAERPRREEGDRPFRERPAGGRDGAPGRSFGGRDGGRDSGSRDGGGRDFGKRDGRGSGAPGKSLGGKSFGGKRGQDDKPAPDFKPYPGKVPERRETRGGEGHFSSEARNRAERSSFGEKKSSGDRKPFGDKPRFARGEGRGDAPRGDRGGDRSGDRSAPRGGGRFSPSADAPMRRTDALPDLRSESEIEGFRSDRIAKVIARAGLASRRDAEAMIAEGRVAVNGVVIASPALDVSAKDRITVDGEPLPARDRTRLWFYHKPRGLVTTARDPEGRDTVFDNLPEDLPRVIAVGRLDINTEGLLLLTNDGGLARVLELPATGWVRRYRVRAFGEVNQAQLDTLRDGLEIDGEQFGPVIATFERQQGANVWLTVDLREGKNREVKRVLEHLGLSVNRLIRISFGPFQLEDLGEGEVREIKSRVLKDQLGPSLMAEAGVDFESDRPASAMRERGPDRHGPDRGGPDRMRPAGFGGETGDRSHPGERAGKRPYSKDEDATPRRRNSWRDDDTEKQVRRSGAPRRGQDPRMERAERADKDGVVRARAGSITDPAGRKIKVERVTGPAAEPARELRRPFLRDRGDFAPEREADVMRDPSRRPNRERWKQEAAEGEASPREAAPRREWQERPPREQRPRGDRPYGDRPPRGERPQGDRPPRRDGPPRGDRPFGDRPPRGDRPQGDRPPRREWQDRPPRGDKPYGDRPPRGDRPQGDRPPRRDGPSGGKGGFGKSGFGGRPGGGKPGGGRPGGRPSGGGKPGGRPSGGSRPRGRG